MSILMHSSDRNLIKRDLRNRNLFSGETCFFRCQLLLYAGNHGHNLTITDDTLIDDLYDRVRQLS